MGLPLRALQLKSQSKEWKHVASPAKEKFLVQRSIKKIILTFFLFMKWYITIDFLEKV